MLLLNVIYDYEHEVLEKSSEVQLGDRECESELPEVVVHVQDIGEERFGGLGLQVELLHLVLDHDGLARDLLSGTTHPQHPRDPLQEHGPHLRRRRQR